MDLPNVPTPSGNADGWCSGKMGCEKFCVTHVVYTTNNNVPSMSQVNRNAQDLTNPKTTDEQLGFHCGCTRADVVANRICDRDFNENFDGTCTNEGVCSEGVDPAILS